MAGFNMGGILKKMLGGDIDKMDDQQFAEAVERVRRLAPPKQDTSIDELKALPIKEWREDPYYVKLVRFTPRQGVQPCEICGQLVGRLSDLMDARFFIEKAEQDHPAPFCLAVDPVTAWPGNPMGLPEAPDGECGGILNSMDLAKVNNAIYDREHPADDDEDEYILPVVLGKASFEAGEYSEFDPEYLYSCVCCTKKAANDGQDMTWLIAVLDQAIAEGLGEYTFPRAERLRGDLFLQAGNKAAALSAYRHALSLDPKIGLKRKVAAMEKELGKDAGL